MSGGPGQLILATAFAIVGGIYGGPAGASAGWTLGMTIGGIIWPLDGGTQEGPRLDDRSVQVSAYGVPIPWLWGSFRIAGNVVWAKEIEERTTIKRVGKSLFSKGTKVYTYTYFGHFALIVCKGPVGNIGRIWADGKLLHDPEVEGKFDRYLTKYLGTETQLPDSHIQADKGIDATPAFRGCAYVVFSGLPLADWSNRLPNILVEIGGAIFPALWNDGTVTNLSSSDWTYNAAQPNVIANTWSNYVTTVDPRTLTAFQFPVSSYWEIRGEFVDGSLVTTTHYPVEEATIALFGDIYGTSINMASTGYARPAIDPLTGDVIVFLQGVTSKSAVARFGAAGLVWVRAFYTVFAVGDNWVFGNKVWMVDQFQDWTYCIDIATGAETWRHDHSADIPTSIYGPINSATYKAADGTVYFTWLTSSIGGGTYADHGIARQSLSTGAILTHVTGFLPAGSTRSFSAVYDATTDSIIIVNETGFVRLDPTTLAVTQTVTMATPWHTSGEQLDNMGTNNAVAGSLWLNDGIKTFWQISTADFSTLWTDAVDTTVSGVPSTVSMGGPFGVLFHIDSTRPMFFGNAYGTNTYKFGDDGSGNATTLAAIITDICVGCEMDTSDIDVSALTAKAVEGYCIARESTGRAAIEPLCSAFAVDAPETNGKLVFRFRKTSSDGTVLAIDLGADAGGSNTVAMTERRKQEVELPLSVTVKYSSHALDYQELTQTTRRIDDTIEAGDPRSVEFPLVLSDQDAKTLSSRLLYLAWVERSSYTFALPPSYVLYDPGDILTVPLDDAAAAQLMITKIEYGGDGVCQIEALATDGLAYLSPADAPIVPYLPPQSVPVIQVMTLAVLDTPLLSDDDDEFGFMVGAIGTSSAWSGGGAYASQDATTYELAAGIVVPTPIGYAGTALATHTSALLDRTSVLRVVFPYPITLSSVTELEMLAGANLLMLGSEVIGFATATAVTSTSYDLSTLRRGVQGTEWSMPHASGERVVLLDDSVQAVELPLSLLGSSTYWKGISLGDTLDEGSAQTVVGTGIRIKPLSPVHILGSRDGSNNLTVEWTRRARLNSDWLDYFETPLDEPVEAYSIDVVVGSSVVRTLAATAPTVTYDAASQSSDGITPGDPVAVRVYQISSRVGRGYPGSATV